MYFPFYEKKSLATTLLVPIALCVQFETADARTSAGTPVTTTVTTINNMAAGGAVSQDGETTPRKTFAEIASEKCSQVVGVPAGQDLDEVAQSLKDQHEGCLKLVHSDHKVYVKELSPSEMIEINCKSDILLPENVNIQTASDELRSQFEKCVTDKEKRRQMWNRAFWASPFVVLSLFIGFMAVAPNTSNSQRPTI